MKLWDKGFATDKAIEVFTIGKDNELDLHLAPFDVLGTLAHIEMLESIGLLTADELKTLQEELIRVYDQVQENGFRIEEGVEDIHSQVEMLLTAKLGDVGKKVHSGRSRNDQVLIDLKLFIRSELAETAQMMKELFDLLINLSETHKETLMPGYTHFQVAMPSSFGLWFGAYAESLADDLLMLQTAYRIANRNPLGSAAGYGSSFPLNRQMTTDLLGFESMAYNVVYAQMGRGKTERTVSFAMASVAATLSKMAMDICLYMGQNFGFLTFPKEFTTGSSIMPHKKNPDVFELIRAKCNKLQALPNEITLIANNLPAGYHRDLQIIKESFVPAFAELKSCLQISRIVLGNIIINKNILDDPKYDYLFSVEEVNNLVLQGVPFREAYKTVGLNIESGNYTPNKSVAHTHQGSIGNLCNQQISGYFNQVYNDFEFSKVEDAFNKLLGKQH